MLWIAFISFVFVILAILFVLIARKGRALRTNQPLPPVARQASIEFSENGKPVSMELIAPFYFGRKQDSDIVIADAHADFEACIFYHNRRFAIQSLPGAGLLRVNEEEMPAGYLRDGDRLEIAGRRFVFRCR